MILVIGDSILDVYIDGDSTRLCPEAPAPVILNPQKTEKLGGALNVFSNLSAFQSTVELLTDKNNISKKTRIVANGKIIARIDEEKYTNPGANIVFSIPDYSLIVMSDYNKGSLISADLIIQQARHFKVPVFVDPKREFEFYRGATLLKANKDEVEAELQRTWTNSVSDAHEICEKFDFKYLVVTLGENGIFLYDNVQGASLYATGWQQNVVDVTGAGDVVLATLAHYFDKGVDMVEAATRANIFASKSVTTLGNYVLTAQDIKDVEDGIYQRGLRPLTRRPPAPVARVCQNGCAVRCDKHR